MTAVDPRSNTATRTARCGGTKNKKQDHGWGSSPQSSATAVQYAGVKLSTRCLSTVVQYESTDFALCSVVEAIYTIAQSPNYKRERRAKAHCIRLTTSLSPQISSATNTACNSNSNVTFGIMLTAMNSGRG